MLTRKLSRANTHTYTTIETETPTQRQRDRETERHTNRLKHSHSVPQIQTKRKTNTNTDRKFYIDTTVYLCFSRFSIKLVKPSIQIKQKISTVPIEQICLAHFSKICLITAQKLRQSRQKLIISRSYWYFNYQ